MKKISLHRALSELKIIDTRISNKLTDLSPTAIVQENNKLIRGKSVEEFIDKAKKDNQSINDLIDRKIALKTAISEANSKTVLTVGDKKMTILEAISYKEIIRLKGSKLSFLKSTYGISHRELKKSNDKIDEVALRLAENTLGKQEANSGSETVNVLIDTYKKSNKYSMIDPLNILTMINDLEKEIYDFEIEIDSVLSETNAITLIEV